MQGTRRGGDRVRAGVVVLSGLPGAGKTTLARAMAERLPGTRVIDKDQVRQALFAPFDGSAAERTITFTAMLDAARYHLTRRRIVVLDGFAFLRRRERASVLELVRETGAFVADVVCDVPVEVAIVRCEGAADAHPATNRDADTVRRVAAEMEEPDAAYLTVDMTGSVDAAVEHAVAYVHDCAA